MRILGLRVVLLSFGMAWSIQAVEASSYAHVECYAVSPGSEPTTSYEGFVAFESEALVEHTDGGFTLRASPIQKNRLSIADTHCSSLSRVLDSWGENGRPNYVWKDRGWNALALVRRDSLLRMTCGTGSLLEIFNSKAAWLEAQARQISTNPEVPNFLSHRSCFLDRFE